jgi:polyisoprenoid-binding protein YceI
MKIRLKKFLLIALIAAGFSARADAKTWTVDYTQSKLGFTGMQGTNAFQGTFKNFKTDIDFDPDHPETGKIAATVDIASASTGDGEKDGMLPQSDWFDTSKFPQAQFTSAQIRKTGANSYEAQGNLTIKGIAKAITLPFTLTQEGDHWRAQGKTTLTRTDFHIGAGQWSSDDTVKLGVDVTIDIAAKPVS